MPAVSEIRHRLVFVASVGLLTACSQSNINTATPYATPESVPKAAPSPEFTPTVEIVYTTLPQLTTNTERQSTSTPDITPTTTPSALKEAESPTESPTPAIRLIAVPEAGIAAPKPKVLPLKTPTVAAKEVNSNPEKRFDIEIKMPQARVDRFSGFPVWESHNRVFSQNEEGLFGIDLATGEKWSSPLKNTTIYRGDRDLLYVTDNDQDLVALSSKNGKEVWRIKLQNTEEDKISSIQTSSNFIVVHLGFFYFRKDIPNPQTTTTVINKLSGEMLWRKEGSSSGFSSRNMVFLIPQPGARPLESLLDINTGQNAKLNFTRGTHINNVYNYEETAEDTLLVSQEDGTCIAYDFNSLGVRWNCRDNIGRALDYSLSGPNHYYLLSKDANHERQVFKVDKKSGRILFGPITVPDVSNQLDWHGDYAFYGNSGSGWWIIDNNTGSVRHSTAKFSSVIGVYRDILVGYDSKSDGQNMELSSYIIHGYDISNGKPAWNPINIGSTRLAGSPIMVDGKVYAATPKSLAIYSPETGREIQSFERSGTELGYTFAENGSLLVWSGTPGEKGKLTISKA